MRTISILETRGDLVAVYKVDVPLGVTRSYSYYSTGSEAATLERAINSSFGAWRADKVISQSVIDTYRDGDTVSLVCVVEFNSISHLCIEPLQGYGEYSL